MTIRRGTLYVGAFLLATGAVTLAAAADVINRTATASAVQALWPLAIIAIGVGLVLRRSPAALGAGLIAAVLPGLALGASVVAAPSLPIPCADDPVSARRNDATAPFKADFVFDARVGSVTSDPQGGCK